MVLQAPQGRSERCDGVMGSWLHGYSLDSMKIAMLGNACHAWHVTWHVVWHVFGYPILPSDGLPHRRVHPVHTPESERKAFLFHSVLLLLLLFLWDGSDLISLFSLFGIHALGVMETVLRLSWDCLESLLSLSWVSLESLSRIQGFWGYPLGFLGLHNVPHRVLHMVSTWYPIGYP